MLSPKKVAQAIGVSESSLKRWCDDGLLSSVRTAGGHRRLTVDSVLQFLKKTGQQLEHPDVLGLPPLDFEGRRSEEQICDDLFNTLIRGDQETARTILISLFVQDRSIAWIGDHIVAPVFYRIGEGWACGSVDIYQERLSCEICLRVLHEIGSLLPAPAADAPLAIGGTVEFDVYTLSTSLVELVLKQLGWRARSMGSGIPFNSLKSAILSKKPKLFWLSVSYIENENSFVEEWNDLYNEVDRKTAIVIGGRTITHALREKLHYSAFLENLDRLESFARPIYSPPSR